MKTDILKLHKTYLNINSANWSDKIFGKCHEVLATTDIMNTKSIIIIKIYKYNFVKTLISILKKISPEYNIKIGKENRKLHQIKINDKLVKFILKSEFTDLKKPKEYYLIDFT